MEAGPGGDGGRAVMEGQPGQREASVPPASSRKLLHVLLDLLPPQPGADRLYNYPGRQDW